MVWRVDRPAVWWGRVLVLLVAVRVAIPLAVLAAHGHGVPGLPTYHYNPRPGDAYGYYSAVRELLNTWRQPTVLLAAVIIVLVASVLTWRLARSGRRAFALLAAAYGLGLVGAVLAHRMGSSGAPTIGWPLVWSVPLLPYRALGLPLGPNLAFAVGLTLSLAANAVTLVGTAVLGRRVTGRPLVGLGAAALYAVWPFLSGLVGGHRAWQNGTWLVDAGLHLYSEPLSTALVVVALVLVVVPRPAPVELALAGTLLSLASVVRLSNAVIAAIVLIVTATHLRPQRTLPLLLGLGAFLPLALAYWSKGYTSLPAAQGGLPPRPFALRYVRIAWTDSLLWRPSVLLLLLPLAAIGTLAVLGTWRRYLLWLVIAGTAAFYSVYTVTDIHPRFLYVVFPPVLVLWCTGAWVVFAAATGRGAAATSAAAAPSVNQKSTDTVAPPKSAMPARTPSSDAVQDGAT